MTGIVWKRLKGHLFPKRPARRASRATVAAIETLEPRLVLYANTGNAWPSPQVITIGFVPDGANLGGVYNDINAVFNNSVYIGSQWQAQILKAAQSWAQKSNINFVLISDNGGDFGSGDYQQGDPAMADIRISGYNFGNSSLATAFLPPPVNNFSVAGDIMFNTSVQFRVGQGTDLFSVAAHEFGHALGLDHTTSGATSVMWGYYNGVKTALSTDDTNGIRNIYSADAARSSDVYESNNTFGTATDLTSNFSSTQLDGVIDALDITTTTDVDYFKFTAPTGVGSTLSVSMQSSGLSLLAPKFTVYASNQTTVLGTASSTGYGATLNLQISGLSAGQTYYIKAQGANTTAFGTGQYALVVNMGTGADPTVTLPNTMLLNGNPLQVGGGMLIQMGRGHEFGFEDDHDHDHDHDHGSEHAESPIFVNAGRASVGTEGSATRASSIASPTTRIAVPTLRASAITASATNVAARTERLETRKLDSGAESEATPSLVDLQRQSIASTDRLLASFALDVLYRME